MKGRSNRDFDTLYETVGGSETCHRLSNLFHDRVAADPDLRRVFPKDLAATTERLALFLAERIGGPGDYTARRGKGSLVCRHAHVPIGAAERDAWLGHMFTAIDAAGITSPARELLREYFAETADTVTDPLLPFYRVPLNELQAMLAHDPSVATFCDLGRTMLNEAAGRWDLPRVQMLLEHGADTNVEGPLGHTALYYAANALSPASEADGRAVVELLIRHGAHVNHRSGPGRMTPLHMAARRGTTLIAEALLISGAEIEAKDVKGETPLRRGVNCNQENMVRLLLSLGADPLTVDKRGCTALAAWTHKSSRKAKIFGM